MGLRNHADQLALHGIVQDWHACATRRSPTVHNDSERFVHIGYDRFISYKPLQWAVFAPGQFPVAACG